MFGTCSNFSTMSEVNIFWFRRDLRLHDNAALYHALKSKHPVLPIFIFDENILNELPKNDKRVLFIHRALQHMQSELERLGSSLKVMHGKPLDIFKTLMESHRIETVFTNHDYEPYAQTRDAEVAKLLLEKGIRLKTYKDQVVFEKEEVLKDDGTPYTVFTPYSKKWKAKMNDFYLSSYPTQKYGNQFCKCEVSEMPSLEALGFESSNLVFFESTFPTDIIANYHNTRDIPSLQGTSRLSVHLRFGTISIRELVRSAVAHNEKFLNELIWRDFYQSILWHFPHVVQQSFKPKYDHIEWRNHEQEFAQWCKGETGYPIVDAGMRELNETGWMHNRVRMIVASFLTKHLLIDWRWGEAYFAKMLLDFDLASNNGGWQWASGSGVDAAPYFRIFNPYLQTLKFDPQLKYIRKWVPEFESFSYPKPIVIHEVARERCLKVYKEALN